MKTCINCFQPSSGNYGFHVHPDYIGPELYLCDNCGENSETIEDMQEKFKKRFVAGWGCLDELVKGWEASRKERAEQEPFKYVPGEK